MKKIPIEIKELIINLRKEGKTISEIADKTKTSESSVGRILRESNIPNPSGDDSKAVRKMTKGIDLNDPQLQLFFNLNRIAKECGSSLREFLTKVEYNYNELLKVTNNPQEVYLFLMDLSLAVFSLNFEKPKVVERILGLVKRGIYLSNIETKINQKQKEYEELKGECMGFFEVFKEKKALLNSQLGKIAEKIQYATYFHKGQTEPNSISNENMLTIANVLLSQLDGNEVI